MRCLLQKGRLRIARSDPEEHFTFSGPSIAGLLGCQILRQLLQRLLLHNLLLELLLQCLLLKLLLQRLIDRVLLIDQVLRSHAIRLRSLANLTGSENVAQSVAERAAGLRLRSELSLRQLSLGLRRQLVHKMLQGVHGLGMLDGLRGLSRRDLLGDLSGSRILHLLLRPKTS